MQKSLHDIGNLISSISRPEYLKDLIAEARNIPDKLDDVFEGMIDDDAFIDGDVYSHKDAETLSKSW